MSQINCNCIICAEEFDPNELHNVALSKINVTKFKICEACLELSDPSDDYLTARKIVNDYLNFTKSKDHEISNYVEIDED
jgi:hypothetical protein